MDPWRQQILADIGISTWTERGQMPTLAAQDPHPEALLKPALGKVVEAAGVRVPQTVAQAPAKPQLETSGQAQGTGAGSALAALAQSLDAGSTARVSRRPTTQTAQAAPAQLETQAQAVRYPEVACLWSGNAVLFCPPVELHGQVRLVKDILASAANNWTQATEQVVFRWAELQASGFATAEADRALLAFAEKRIEVATARWVLCTPSLQPLLAQLVLPEPARLLGLAELVDLAREAPLKQELWRLLHEGPNAVPQADG